MWDNVQDEFERSVEPLQRQRSGRRLTRHQRRIQAHQEQLRNRSRENVAAEMARARSPDENPLDNANLAEEEHARAGQSWQTEEEVTGEALGRSRDMALRGAAANVVETVRGTPLPIADSTRHVNTPASERVREVIDRRNAARELWEAAERGPPQDQWGGARPRDQQPPRAFGRGGYMSQGEMRRVASPERAFNLNDEHGRFLAQRLERQARLEGGRGRDNLVDVNELRRRHDEDRAGWRRERDEMVGQMRELREQLDAMRLQQQQPPQVPDQQQPQQAPQPPQNQLNIPPPPPQPPRPPPVPPMPAEYNPFMVPPQPVMNVPPVPPPLPPRMGPGHVGNPGEWDLPPPHLVPPQRQVATPVGARTPQGFTPQRQGNADGGQARDERIDRRNLKLRIFKGKDIEAWKSLFEDFAEQFRWTQREKKLQLKANVEDWIRNMLTGMDPETTAEEMMTRLVNRFGVNLTATEVENKLISIERKSGEDLYSLADRVRNLAHRANFVPQKRNVLMRNSFFTALRGNSEMQHFVNRYDDPARPDINNTLDLAIEWERRHGTSTKNERVRQVNAYSDGCTDVTRTDSEGETIDSETINKISYVPVREMKTDSERKLAKQNNDTVSLLKRLAHTVLDDDNRSSSSRGRSWSRGRGSYSSYSSRSSSEWSRPRRRSSRDRRDNSQRDWKGRDKRRSSRDRSRKRSKERFKSRKDGKFDKKKREGRVNEVQGDSAEESDASQDSTSSHSQSEEDAE